MTQERKTALIVGATGNIGPEVGLALIKRGWTIRALSRNPDAARAGSPLPASVEWVGGDAMNEADVVAAAKGVSIIVHAAHPAGYKNWKGLSMPMLESAIAAAKASGARIVFPGTIYNYGPEAFPLLKETSPQNPKTRKGAIRVALEDRLSHIKTPLSLSVLGCVVNGPGEARETDIGITGGGAGKHMVYLSGVTDHHVQSADMLDHIVALVEQKAAEIEAGMSDAGKADEIPAEAAE